MKSSEVFRGILVGREYTNMQEVKAEFQVALGLYEQYKAQRAIEKEFDKVKTRYIKAILSVLGIKKSHVNEFTREFPDVPEFIKLEFGQYRLFDQPDPLPPREQWEELIAELYKDCVCYSCYCDKYGHSHYGADRTTAIRVLRSMTVQDPSDYKVDLIPDIKYALEICDDIATPECILLEEICKELEKLEEKISTEYSNSEELFDEIGREWIRYELFKNQQYMYNGWKSLSREELQELNIRFMRGEKVWRDEI